MNRQVSTIFYRRSIGRNIVIATMTKVVIDGVTVMGRTTVGAGGMRKIAVGAKTKSFGANPMPIEPTAKLSPELEFEVERLLRWAKTDPDLLARARELGHVTDEAVAQHLEDHIRHLVAHGAKEIWLLAKVATLH
jgi:hypothetical protein